MGFTVAQPGATCPYKGLAAFQPEDAALFFGREELVDKLVSRMQAASALVIGGPSGCGKSSLMRAGLLPAIEAGALPGSQGWSVALFTPGTEALKELHRILTDTLEGPVPSLAELRADPGSVRSIASGRDGLLLAIDQFEELFTSAPPDDAKTFLAVLAALVAPAASRVRIVMSIRADFYAECADHEWLARCISDNQILVGPMRRAELRRAIELPAARVGLRLEDGLTETVLDDAAAASGSLPLIGHALMETWLRRRGTLLTLEGFRSAGGVIGAMTQRADALYRQLDPREQAVARQLLLRLVNPGDGTPDTRRRVTWRELGDDPVQRRIIDALAAARLVTVDDDRVEIAHESLIHGWPLLDGWIEQAREDLRTRARILRAAEEWDGQGRNAALLYRGSPLGAASNWAAAHPGDLGPLESDFIAASEAALLAETEATLAEQHRRRRVRRAAVTALGVLAVAAVVASAARVHRTAALSFERA